MKLPNECMECPYWHRDNSCDYLSPWGYSPWGDCEKLSEEDNPLIEYDIPLDKCPLRCK